MEGIRLQNVPQDRLAANLDHRLGPYEGLFTSPRAAAACQNHCFHEENILREPCLGLTPIREQIEDRPGLPWGERLAGMGLVTYVFSIDCTNSALNPIGGL